MKQFLFCAALALAVGGAEAQTSARISYTPAVKLPELDKSPLDICYYPVNYPVLKIQDKAAEPLMARVIYSRPQANNRLVFGGLVEWNKVWRLGANEATELELYRDVRIGGKKVPKGKYSLYAIPDSTQWTLILNKDTDTWGAFKYDEKKDVVRVPLTVKKLPVTADAFSMMFEKGDKETILLHMAWENAMVSLPMGL